MRSFGRHVAADQSAGSREASRSWQKAVRRDQVATRHVLVDVNTRCWGAVHGGAFGNRKPRWLHCDIAITNLFRKANTSQLDQQGRRVYRG